MLIVALIIFALIPLAAFICGVAIGRSGREALRLEIANLTGRLSALTTAYKGMERIAFEAVKLAHVNHFPDSTVLAGEKTATEAHLNAESVARSMPNYVPPQEKHCPECSVSVRSDSWPAECPNCGSVFGFTET